MEEQKEVMEDWFQVTINSNFKDLPSLDEALNYIKKKWNKDSTYASIKLMRFKKVK